MNGNLLTVTTSFHCMKVVRQEQGWGITVRVVELTRDCKQDMDKKENWSGGCDTCQCRKDIILKYRILR